jgi:ribonuclease Z
LVLAIAILAIVLVYMQRNSILERSIRRTVIANQASADKAAAALQRTDRITVVLCGVGSPLAREGAQSCTAVFVSGQFLLFDAGDGAMAAMRASNLPLDELDAVFITHYHNDHYADLGDVMEWSWILGRRLILPVHGPTGIAQIVDGLQSAYGLEATYRTAHHGEELMPPEWVQSEPVEFTPPEGDSALVVYDQDGVVVKAFRANHEPVEPSVGYRIEHQGKVVVLSGDTVRTGSLLANSRNADLLVSEAMNKGLVQVMEGASEEIGNTVNATLLYDIQDYHMDIGEVGALAQEANVQRLALNHLAPRPGGRLLANLCFRDPARAHYSGDIYVGTDGMQIEIPLAP